MLVSTSRDLRAWFPVADDRPRLPEQILYATSLPPERSLQQKLRRPWHASPPAAIAVRTCPVLHVRLQTSARGFPRCPPSACCNTCRAAPPVNCLAVFPVREQIRIARRE